jgi:hypothetical protein
MGDIRSSSFVPFMVKVLAFPIPAMSAMTRDHGDRRAMRATSLCLRPSARTPPGVGVLLITKAQPQFDRAVTERSKLFLRFFSAPNRPNFSLFFSFSLFGRQRVATLCAVPNAKDLQQTLRPIAICQLLTAYFFKELLGDLTPWGASHNNLFCRAN